MSDTFHDAYGQEIELTTEQQACLKYTGTRTLMVKGYAGAGKSIVLMAIAEKYKQAYGTNAANKVAIFTFQNTLVETTKEILSGNDIGSDGIVVSTFNGYCQDVYGELINQKVAPKRRYPYGKDADTQRLKNVEAALKEHQAKYGKHRFHDLDLNFWKEEFDWMKDMNVWTDDLDYYLSIPRTGRGGKVRMRASERVTAYQIFVTYCNYLERTGQGDWADQALFLVRHRDQIPENRKYEHVLIDEAQDLSLAQMMAVLGVYSKDMTVAMDMNQRIHAKYWTPKLLGIETTTRKLTKSMRTTRQIDNLAESIRRHNDSQLDEDDKSLRAVPEKDGQMPKLVHLKDQAAEKKYVIELIRSYLKANDQITIGLIGSKKTQMGLFSAWLADAGIEHEQVAKKATFSMKKPGVKVVTAHGAKGLEFNVVIIPMFAQGYFPYDLRVDDQETLDNKMIQMRNLVYVSMTRAKAQLVLTYWGNNGSQFIGEMDPALYTLEGDPIQGSYAAPVRVLPTAGKSKDDEQEEPKPEKPEKPKETAGNPIATIVNKILGKSEGTSSAKKEQNLVEYLKSEDVSVNDKRNKGGALWISGSKAKLDPIMKETQKRFGAYWHYSEKRSGYFTKCTK